MLIQQVCGGVRRGWSTRVHVLLHGALRVKSLAALDGCDARRRDSLRVRTRAEGLERQNWALAHHLHARREGTKSADDDLLD